MTANRFASIVTLLCVFFPMTFPRGEAIICYECNSEYDPRCGDPFDPYSLGTVNCSFQPRLEHLSALEPTICRKISQRVYGKERVVRGCGYITDERDNRECLLRSGTHDVRAVYCSCTGDLCNGATAATGSPSVLLPAAAALLSLAFFAFSVLPPPPPPPPPAAIRLSSIPRL